MERFVLGLAFDEHGGVLLVRKNKPAWQAGKLNGLGGKVEDSDPSTYSAMRREWDEEANHGHPARSIAPLEWREFCQIEVPERRIRVHCFRAQMLYLDMAFREGMPTDTGEIMRRIPANAVHRFNVIPNLTWLVPMALDPEVIGCPAVVMMKAT